MPTKMIRSQFAFSAILAKVFDRVLAEYMTQDQMLRAEYKDQYGSTVIVEEPYRSKSRELQGKMDALANDRSTVIQELSSWLKVKEIPLESVKCYPRRVYFHSFLTDNGIQEYSDPSPDDLQSADALVIMDYYLGLALVLGIPEQA